MRFVLISVLFATSTTGALAQNIPTQWAERAGDAPLTQAQMAERLVGQSLTFYDDGVSVYSADGGYSYTYDGGGTSIGNYQLHDNGVVCVDFENGWARCDRFVQSRQRLVLVTEDGDRFPIRP